MDHYEEQRKLLKFKDEVIWKMSEELKKKYDFYQEEFDKETRHEMNEWARLVDLYSAELKKYEQRFGLLSLSESLPKPQNSFKSPQTFKTILKFLTEI